jgi:hypothetical protein
MKTVRLILIPIVLLLGFSLCFSTQASEFDQGFDHFSTGFPLTGKHESIDCSSCHLYGQFKGTPRECFQCHNGSRADGKNAKHPPSSNFCDDCHTVYSWSGATYDHSDVTGECQSCHNNSVAVGKSAAHIATTDTCEDCHNTITFTRVANVDHDDVFGTCESCHNGVTATGKNPGHITTIAACDYCHLNTNSWLGAVFDHSTVTGACSSCHNGAIATGKPLDHVSTTDECGYCHTTNAWRPALTPP